MSKRIQFPNKPYAPAGSKSMKEVRNLGLGGMRDAMGELSINREIEKQIKSILLKWKTDPTSILPFSAFRDILEKARQIPASNKRIAIMNTIVRTIGNANNLATFLDMLRDASSRNGSHEQQLCKSVLQGDKMHSVYGWCGNTTIVESFDFPQKGTYSPIDGLEDKLGTSTNPWKLIIHIWQPNRSAKGFRFKEDKTQPKVVMEPPHSHPFDFVSMIVKGRVYQSIYEKVEDKGGNREGHYKGVELVHVDGVWPPHDFQQNCYLETTEHRVLLEEGDSYYMPCAWVHDVEVDSDLAKRKPTISLFLSSEFMVLPHVFMSKSMAKYHSENPDIKKNGKPISEENWHRKLELISDYLRGKKDELNLNDLIGYEGEYAFQHIL